MTILNTVTLSDFTRLADFDWLKALDSVTSKARGSGLFRDTIFPAGTGDTREYNEIDLEEYSSLKAEGDQASQARVQQGYTKILGLRRFGKDISLTWEMRRRNKYDTVLTRIKNLAKMQVNKLDLDLSHVVTFALATSYVDKDGETVDTSVGDTLSLANTAHTLQGSATTFRNILANNPRLSRGSLEGMELLGVEQTYNQFGEKMAMSFDILWTTDDPNTINTAKELLQSTASVSAPNEGVPNVYMSKYRHVSLPRVATNANGAVDSTKKYYWGIASSENTSSYLAMEQEPTLNSPAATKNSEEVSTEDWTYTGRTSYGIATVGSAWFKFSAGDGSA